MRTWRDSREVVLCDACYRIPPARTVRVAYGPLRAVRVSEKGRVYRDGSARDELHFCNAECEASYRAPARGRESA
jgi:hypothetical protein